MILSVLNYKNSITVNIISENYEDIVKLSDYKGFTPNDSNDKCGYKSKIEIAIEELSDTQL